MWLLELNLFRKKFLDTRVCMRYAIHMYACSFGVCRNQCVVIFLLYRLGMQDVVGKREALQEKLQRIQNKLQKQQAEVIRRSLAWISSQYLICPFTPCSRSFFAPPTSSCQCFILA